MDLGLHQASFLWLHEWAHYVAAHFYDYQGMLKL